MDDRTPANLDEAIEWAIGIRERFPERLLCGSATLVRKDAVQKAYELVVR